MSAWDRLWERRVRRFWKEALIYWSYAAQSGLALMLILLFTGGSYLYIKTLQRLPAAFPYWRVTAPVLVVALGFSPIRTFLKEADRVFLMPAEYALTGYFRRSMIYSFFIQAFFILAALLLVWPLYIRCTDDKSMPFVAAVAAFLIAKAASLLARKHELRLDRRSHRTIATCMRWVGAAMFSFEMFIHHWALAGVVLLFWTFVLALAFKSLPKHFIPWNNLIEQEQKQAARHYFFYSWFADVPELPPRSRPRRLFAAIAEALPFEQRNTFLYLMVKTWVRSDLFGIAARIVIAAAIMLTVFNYDLIRLMVYAGSMLMSGATLTGLGQLHRHSVWLALYPVPTYFRGRASALVAFGVLLGQNIMIGGLLIVFSANKLTAAAAVLIGIAWSWFFSFISLQRKVNKAEH